MFRTTQLLQLQASVHQHVHKGRNVARSHTRRSQSLLGPVDRNAELGAGFVLVEATLDLPLGELHLLLRCQVAAVATMHVTRRVLAYWRGPTMYPTASPPFGGPAFAGPPSIGSGTTYLLHEGYNALARP